jgi:hypothetical protein
MAQIMWAHIWERQAVEDVLEPPLKRNRRCGATAGGYPKEILG